MVLDNIFLLNWPPILAIAVIALIITFVVTIVYKYTTNQKRMKELRTEQKKMQKEIRANPTNTKKNMETQKKMMTLNKEYFKHSFRSTIYTILPILLIFSWMNAHFGYEQIMPGDKFQVIAELKDSAEGTISLEVPEEIKLLSNATQPVDDKVYWKLRGSEGLHTINYTYKDEWYTQDILITEEWRYLSNNIEKGDKLDDVKQVVVDLQSTRPLKGVPILGGLNWLWTYIIISFAGSLGFKKLLKVY